MSRDIEIAGFMKRSGWQDAALNALSGDASFRRYLRARRGSENAMLMDAPPSKENVRPYIAVAGHLAASGYSAPHILARDEQAGFLLLEDLGDNTFSAELRQNPDKEPALYEAAVDLLADWHGANSLQHTSALSLPKYDEALLLKEIALFADWFLPAAMGKEEAIVLQAEYQNLWQEILKQNQLKQNLFVHRDYHADNLMWLPREGAKRVGLLDFQDAVYGDPAYDLVSLLEDARRDVNPKLAAEMIGRYLKKTGGDQADFARRYALLGAQRNSKIIGIFTRLAARDGKQHYLKMLPRVWAHLERDVQHPALAELKIWLNRNIPSALKS